MIPGKHPRSPRVPQEHDERTFSENGKFDSRKPSKMFLMTFLPHHYFLFDLIIDLPEWFTSFSQTKKTIFIQKKDHTPTTTEPGQIKIHQ